MRVRFHSLLAVAICLAGSFSSKGGGYPATFAGPTVSHTDIVFAYGGYLWTVPGTAGQHAN